MSPTSKPLPTSLLALALAAGAGASCLDDQSGRTDSQSHWLAPCVDDGDCGALSCTCFVCADPCGPANGTCSDDAACVPLNVSNSACFATEYACVPRCELEGCPNDGICDAGECLPRVAISGEVPDGALTAAYAGLFPAVNDDGAWRRQCGTGPVDGVLIGLGVRANGQPVAPTQGLVANDPVTGNVSVAYAMAAVATQFTLADGSLLASRPEGSGQVIASSELVDSAAVRVVAPGGRPVGTDAILLIDQSGSLGGLVDATRGNVETGQVFTPPSNFGALASDRLQQRLAFGEKWVERTSGFVRVGVIAFSEDTGLKVPCDGATGDLDTDLATCFGGPLARWSPPATGVFSLAGQTGERANLWQAVARARDFLREVSPDPARARHIVVISDGPDTCARGEALNSCETPCSSAPTWSEIRAAIAADEAAGLPPIHISVVQFESIGYPGPDMRQMEAACATGGQYHFIASNALPRDRAEPMAALLDGALDALIGGMRGVWDVAVPLELTRVGVHEELSASLRLPAVFDAGALQLGLPGDTVHTANPVLRSPCGSDAACGYEGLGACEIGCSPETSLCAVRDTFLPDTTACALGDADGFCCGGTCQPLGGQCAACGR